MVPTGVAIALPDGYAAFVHPRSGLAHRFGVGVVNAPGTVDAGYRGEIKVLLVNHDPTNTVRLNRGDRIAQLVVQRVERARFHEVQVLPGSARGAGGHGSTGGFASTDTQLDDSADCQRPRQRYERVPQEARPERRRRSTANEATTRQSTRDEVDEDDADPADAAVAAARAPTDRSTSVR